MQKVRCSLLGVQLIISFRFQIFSLPFLGFFSSFLHSTFLYRSYKDT